MSKLNKRNKTNGGDSPEPPRGYDPKNSGNNSYEPNRRYPDAATGITTGMKAGWMVLGILLGVLSLPIILIVYWRRDAELRFKAFRYTLIGVGIGMILQFLLIGWLNSAHPDLANEVLGTTPAEPGSSGWTSTNF